MQTEKQPHRRTRFTRSRSRILLTGLAIACLLILGLEGLARAFNLVRPFHKPAPVNWYRFSSELGWERQPGFFGEVFGGQRQFARSGLVAVDEADLTHPDLTRIITLGDSNTFGFGVPTEQTFCEQLQTQYPNYACINLGVVGYTSWQGSKTLEWAGRVLKPAAAVVSFNFNDRRLVVPPAVPDSAEYFRQVARAQKIQALGNHFYLLAALQRLAGVAPPLMVDEQQELKTMHSELMGVEINSLLPRVPPAAYRENLLAMVETGRAAGVKIIFLLLQDNPLEKQPLMEGMRLLEAGEYEAAIKTLEPLCVEKNIFCMLARRELAKALEKLGRKEEAAAALRIDHPLTTLHGSHPLYFDTDYKAIMLEVAGETGTPVVDAASLLDADPSVFTDFVHFNGKGHAEIANALAPLVGQALASK